MELPAEVLALPFGLLAPALPLREALGARAAIEGMLKTVAKVRRPLAMALGSPMEGWALPWKVRVAGPHGGSDFGTVLAPGGLS